MGATIVSFVDILITGVERQEAREQRAREDEPNSTAESREQHRLDAAVLVNVGMLGSPQVRGMVE